jgi:hypothetical protein
MERVYKTPYERCLERKLRVIGLENVAERELEFYTQIFETDKEVDKFIDTLPLYDGVSIQGGKLHLKSEKYLELRMYTLVPYNLLGIQMGIQHEHAVVQHLLNNVHCPHPDSRRVERWASKWKTSVLLNGGTSNEGHWVEHGEGKVWYVGSMQQHLEKIKATGIKYSTFYEPDLNSMLTGISFILDERVFNKKLYPNYVELPFNPEIDGVDDFTIRNWEDNNAMCYAKWVEKMGGEQNVEMRKIIQPLSLARG